MKSFVIKKAKKDNEEIEAMAIAKLLGQVSLVDPHKLRKSTCCTMSCVVIREDQTQYQLALRLELSKEMLCKPITKT